MPKNSKRDSALGEYSQMLRMLGLVAMSLSIATSGCCGRRRCADEASTSAGRTDVRPVAPVLLNSPLVGQWERRVWRREGQFDHLSFTADGVVVLLLAAPGGARRYVGRWTSSDFCGHEHLLAEPSKFELWRDCVWLDFGSIRPEELLVRAPFAADDYTGVGRFRLVLWRGRLFEDWVADQGTGNPRFMKVLEDTIDAPYWRAFEHVVPVPGSMASPSGKAE